MKTELKHLAPYLPYGLYGSVEDFEENTVHLNVKIMSIDIDDLCLSFDQCLDVYLDEPKDAVFKPILRPLSDLTKQIEGLEIDYEDELSNWFGEVEINKMGGQNKSFYCRFDSWVTFKDYHSFIEKLFEWHFDVFGLIEKGLAIDINEINQQ